MAPDSPTLQVSSTLRPLVGVFAIGAILLLLAVSGADAVDSLRTERNQRGLPERDDSGDPIGAGTTSNGSGHKGGDLPAEDENGAAVEGAATNNPRHKPTPSPKSGQQGPPP